MLATSPFWLTEVAKHLLVAASGVALWVGVNIAFGTKEPWHTELYLTVSYPAALVIAAIFGFLFPDLAWRWGLFIVMTQLPVMVVQSGVAPLIVIGVLFLAVLSVPAMGTAMAGAALKRRFSP